MTPFRIMVDASTLRSGGGPIIAAHELEMIHRALGDSVELLLVDGPQGLPLSDNVPVRWLPRPSIDPATPTGIVLWSLVEAPRLIREYRADAYLSFVNWLPLRLPVPAAIYLHSPYVMNLEAARPQELVDRVPRYLLVQYGLRSARAVVVQTAPIQRDVERALDRLGSFARHRPEIVRIAPTGSWMEHKPASEKLRAELERARTNADIWLFYPSIPWVHKNMDGLAAALRRVAQQGIRPGLILPAGGITQEQLGKGERDPVLRSFEGLTQEEMAACYDFADGVIFPSLLETAGLGLVEALARRRPLLGSDREFVHELGGGAAILFNPQSPEDMAEKIVAFARDSERQQHGRARAEKWMAALRDTTDAGWHAVVNLLRAKATS